VHVAYQTSGNIAVFDYDAMRFIDFVREFNKAFTTENKSQNEFIEALEKEMEVKKKNQMDGKQLLTVKGLIRRTEARSAARHLGVPKDHIYPLDLPFYESGDIKKLPLS